MPLMVSRSHLLLLACSFTWSKCAAWECGLGSVGTVRVNVTSGAYDVSVNGRTWLPDGSVTVYSAGEYATTIDGSLTLSGVDAGCGDSDATCTLAWSRRGDASRVATTTFECFGEHETARFDLVMARDLKNANTSWAGPEKIHGDKTPVTRFPSFAGGAGSVLESTELGWLQHGGIWTLNEFWGTGLQNGFNSPSNNGPTYLYNTSFAPADAADSADVPVKPTVLILSPADHFHVTAVAYASEAGASEAGASSGSPRRLAFGPMSTVESIDAGYNSSVVLTAGSLGINEATYRWGAFMRAAYGTRRYSVDRPTSASRAKVGYFTDNGAVYYQQWWDATCKRNCSVNLPAGKRTPQDLLVALPTAHNASLGFVPGVYQLDTWWFIQRADLPTSISSPPMNTDSLAGALWQPRPDMFPRGLRYVTERTPLLLYSWHWTPPGEYNLETNFTWQASYPLPNGKTGGQRRLGMPILEQVGRFYATLRDRFIEWGGISYETDNMGTNLQNFPYAFNSTGGADTWWEGFASPWCEAGIQVQICESTGADIMQSLRYPCVAVSRDNIDHVPQGAKHPYDYFANRWHVGFDRMMLDALEIAPYFDNQWTNESQPGSTWEPAREEYLDLSWILATLSKGPVGFGDIQGAENATLILTASTADGSLLQPSRTSTYLDLVYIPESTGRAPTDPRQGRLFQAPSFIPRVSGGIAVLGGKNTWTTLLSVDYNVSFGVLPADFSPSLVSGTGWLAVPWAVGLAQVDARCADGAKTRDCAAQFGSADPIQVETGVGDGKYTHAYEMWSISPVTAQGWSLIGELGKITRVSPRRFPWVCDSCSSTGVFSNAELAFGVRGSADRIETVDVAVARPDGTVQRLKIKAPVSPAVAVIVCGVGADNSCAQRILAHSF